MNLSFGPPPRVESDCLLARLGTAFGMLLPDGPALLPVFSDIFLKEGKTDGSGKCQVMPI
jgi:hypothetical protein